MNFTVFVFEYSEIRESKVERGNVSLARGERNSLSYEIYFSTARITIWNFVP